MTWLPMRMLKPLTGPANMVAAEANTVVVERLDPEDTPVNHDSVWPSVSIDVHWDGKTAALSGCADRRVYCLGLYVSLNFFAPVT